MRVTGYAYPWDVLDEPGFAARVAELGVAEVAVAVAYHGVRAATPWQTTRSAMHAEHAALYRPVRAEVWRSRELRPEPARWVSTQDSAGAAVRSLAEAGLTAVAWLVLTHNSLLGHRFPDVTVRDCFGRPYPWALCPARPRVREYAATLVAESVRDLPVAGVVLEACGQLGVTHQQAHEKTDAVWSPAVRRLLSLCCCPACAAGWSDPDRTPALVRERVLALVAAGELDRTDDGLPADVRAEVLAGRQRSTDALRAEVLAALGPDPRVTLHGSPDPWETGALPGLTPTARADVDQVVVPCWQPDLGVATVAAAGGGVGAYVTVVAPEPLPDPAGYVRDLAAAGATELHLYHLGLAGPARLPDLRAAIGAAAQS